MQQFNNETGIRRLLNIENMEVNEVKDYYLQFLDLEPEEKEDRESKLKQQIIQSKKDNFYEWILAIKTKDGKIIGKIEVLEMGANKAFFTINLPNKSWKMKYGVEAVKQFIKICSENKYFSELELDNRNSIIQRYVEAYKSKGFLKEYIIDIEKVA